MSVVESTWPRPVSDGSIIAHVLVHLVHTQDRQPLAATGTSVIVAAIVVVAVLLVAALVPVAAFLVMHF